jgi:hypothetical protein
MRPGGGTAPFAHEQQVAARVEETRGVDAAGALEGWLAQLARQ